MKYKKTPGEIVFDSFNTVLMLLLMFITLYPFVYVVFASFSDPAQLVKHQGLLWRPLGFETLGYQNVLKNPMILVGYRNTLFYVVVGTVLNMILTCFAAYALSRKRPYFLKNVIMMAIVFTMFFSGGLVPTYLTVKRLGLYNSMWAVILPTAMSAWNMIIMRTSFAELPDSLEESARLDGANDFTILFRIVIPLSKAVMAVIVLFYAVYQWNAWFNAMIYLKDSFKYPVQLVLRQILVLNDTGSMMVGGEMVGSNMDVIIRYACMIVASVPILCVYPFLQRYFVKGVMIGAVKG